MITTAMRSDDSSASARVLEALDLERERDRRNLRRALIVALAFHGVLLAVTFPELAARARDPSGRQREVFVVQQVRFKPPVPQPQRSQQPPRPRKKRIPIPDPTPDDPEPILVSDFDMPEVEFPEIDLGTVFGIPENPPGGGATGTRPPLDLGGDVEPPVGIYTPQPRYSEEARQARLQGVVLLKSVIDEEGNVTQLGVLKGLPLGLTESALETVRTWKYEPATLNGEPVPVYFHLMVRFSVQ